MFAGERRGLNLWGIQTCQPTPTKQISNPIDIFTLYQNFLWEKSKSSHFLFIFIYLLNFHFINYKRVTSNWLVCIAWVAKYLLQSGKLSFLKGNTDPLNIVCKDMQKIKSFLVNVIYVNSTPFDIFISRHFAAVYS